MPLISGKAGLQADLFAIYNDIGGVGKTVEELAKRKAAAIHKFVLTGKPMTIITTFGGGVVGAMTASPVSGKGLGGIDKPAPGMGLAAAKAILEQELISIWTHGNTLRTAMEQAQKEAAAIYNYFSQAIVMTDDKTDAPVPAPPPVGPVTDTIKGKGGVLTNSPGTGYDAARPIMEAEFIRIWFQIGQEFSVAKFAREMADAIHKFSIEGKVTTTGTFVAPAAVAPPPAPPMGAYFPGIGASLSSTLT